ncbi:MAG: hypothetical protein U1A16_01935 [Patescibacteria group bacterium]|nr:hypothetical protein [Patescibacteria group bacterium]
MALPSASPFLSAGQFGAPVMPQVKAPPAAAPRPAPMAAGAAAPLPPLAQPPAPMPLAAPAAPVNPASFTTSGGANVVNGALVRDTTAPQQGPATPATPPVTPEIQNAVSLAEKAYQDSLKINPEMLSTQEDIDKLIEATKKGYEATSGQPIALEFITGQLAAVERRAAALAEPLERKMARLQAARTSSLDTSKFALERADKQAGIVREEAKTARTEAESQRRFEVEQTGATETRQIARDTFAQTKLAADRTFEESKRQFESNYGLEKSQMEEDKRTADRTYALSVRKFEEDKRQFGQQYALDARKVAVEEAKAKGSKNTSALLSNYQLASDILNLDTDAIAGVQLPFSSYLGSGETVNKYKQLQGILAVENREAMAGSGAISDYEFRVLTEAATALGRNLNNQAFRRELVKTAGVFANAAGLTAKVKITDPQGNWEILEANRAGVDKALADKLTVEYVEHEEGMPLRGNSKNSRK